MRQHKLTVFLIFFIFTSISTLFSQDEDNGEKRRFKMPDGNGTISGTVIDKDSHSPLEGAVVTLFTAKDSARVTGAGTDAKGMFKLDAPYGMYKVEVSYVGYSIAIVNKVALFPKKPDVVLDTIRIKQGNATTEEIEVTTQKSVIQFEADKKVFNVSQSPVSNNGTATDVLKNVPSVTVDNDGNVSLRGSQNVRVMIDGKPIFQNVATILESIPSSSIESVELITNPSAKFEAEGETGFINLVLKQNSNLGYNGSVQLSVGTKDKYNGSLNFNLKNKKFNFYTNLNFQMNRGYFNGNSSKLYTGGTTLADLEQPSNADMKMRSGLGKIGFDYNLTDKQTLGISTTFSLRKRDRTELSTSNGYDNLGALYTQYNTSSVNSEKGNNFEASLNYTGKFKEPMRQLTMEASFSRHYEEEPDAISNFYYINNYLPLTDSTWLHDDTQINKENSAFYQADYVHPFSKETKLETGIKSDYQASDNTMTSNYFDKGLNQWVYDNTVSNNFKYTMYINAAYLIFQSKYKDFGYQAGVRVENTYAKGDLVTTGESFTKKYTDFFPSASISQKVGMSNEFQLSYSRRLNRPRSDNLNPFIERSDPYNIRKGNPDLNPEYIDAYELSYLKYFGNNVITSSMFYRQTHGLISRFRTSIDSLTTEFTQVNLSGAKSYGVELITNLQPVKVWNINGSFSYFKTDIDASNVQPELTNSGYSWTAKFITNIKLWSGVDLSMSYFYMSKRPTALGQIEPMQSMDVSLKRDFMNGRATLSIRGSDIFNTQEMKMYSNNQGIIQNNLRKRDSQNLYVSFTYKFGNIFDKPDMRKKHQRDNNNNNGPDEDF